MNLFGDNRLESINQDQRIKIFTGAAVFHLHSVEEIENKAKDAKQALAKQYAEMVRHLNIPQIAGISSTLDQSVTMAGLVGIGIHDDKKEEQAQLRLAMLAFMVPNKDHSVHEILQSSKSFDLPYTPGPGTKKIFIPVIRNLCLC